MFPILMLVVTQGIGYLFPGQNIATVLHIVPEYLWSFYCSFYLFFVMTGALVPFFYYLSDFNTDVNHRERAFALKYACFIWIPVVFAMLAFGVDALPCIAFSLESIIAFQILMKACGRILDLHF